MMLVMALVMGIAAYSFGGVSGEEVLRRPASEFQRVVLESVRRAALYERPQVIAFDKQGFLVRHPQADQPQRGLQAMGKIQSEQAQMWQRRVMLPGGMTAKLRRWGQRNFTPAAGQRMVIAPGGLCEPLTLRLEQGASWMELTLDPLSGGVAEEAMHVAERD